MLIPLLPKLRQKMCTIFNNGEASELWKPYHGSYRDERREKLSIIVNEI